MSTRKKLNHKERKPVAAIKKVQQKAVMENSVTLKQEKTQVRYLKLKSFYLPRSSKKQKIVPELRLCGKWFQEAGFNPLDYVSVTVMNGLLIIRNAEEITID